MTSSARDIRPAAQTERVGHVELLLSTILRAGVVASLAMVLLGLALTFTHHPDYLHSAADLRRLTSPGAAFPHSLQEVADGARIWRGQAFVTVGLIMLIATPIFRVAASVVIFALERDRVFVLITSAVLAVLLFSFALGKAL